MNLFGDVSGAKPFLKWAGGKRQLIPAIQQALPADFERKVTTYVEPFIGGGAVMFWMLQHYRSITTAIINDINPDLTTAYQVIKEQPEELIKQLAAMQAEYYALIGEDVRREFFDKIRAEFNTRTLDSLRNTCLLIFLNKTCFNGLYRVNSKSKFNVPFGKYEKPLICDSATIRANSHLLSRVTILTGDFSETLKHISGRAFFYFDPPYKPLSTTASFNAYVSEVFNDESQQRLANFCRTLDEQEHYWLLSNSDVKNTDADNHYFDDLYDGFNIRRIQASRNINSKGTERGKISELLISNYQGVPELI
ncbi:DNA adenine methylase [Hymenobacter aerilatus]|uniref:site-specific DNA-methyltransferase (adenine-specific) n=1 Tax=Hymenobacter aerilatus TaxID=2932251 RepID=A0A8T9SWV4_9BACT|nr:DNA adenine methylase [Hymenobacter aerilatus]UOR06217.1 DNA adenine methylase [Hymenobacter aerilatus]